MTAELITKGRQHLFGEVVFAARTEAFVESGAEDWSRNRLVDGSGDCPAPFPRIRHAASELRQVRAIEEGECGQVQQPRRDDASASPDLGNVRNVQVVKVVLGVAQRDRKSTRLNS